jgi:tRNA nucleotidyltransferase (CCA-adding enzyme)
MNIENLDAEDIELPEMFDGLPVFAVGGWVRDTILGNDPHDLDLMVAEVTPEEMRERGFREIDSPNNDTFAVFEDKFNREVAIAREEASTGDGHTAFEVEPVPETVEASEAVERDLKRRDLTINSMALDLRWNVLHDPFNGFRDLERGIIRGTTAGNFQQDPLRILRAARFTGRLDFDIEEATKERMSEAADGLEHLPGERIRMEMMKNFLESDTPRRFFDILSEVGALPHAFPELAALRLIPAGPEAHHREGSAFNHTLLVLEEMNDLLPDDKIALLMALLHDIGKAETPLDELPSHHGHGERGADVIDDMAERLGFSKRQRRAAKEASREHMRLKNINELRTGTVLDAWKHTKNRTRLARLMVADARGREPEGEFDHASLLTRFQRAQDAVAKVQAQDLMDDGHTPEEMGGEEFGNLLRQRRIEAMRSMD